MTLILAQVDSVKFWDGLFSGQVGFILATLIFGVFFWKVLLPRWDRNTAAIERLADAVRLLVIKYAEKDGLNGEELIKEADKLRQ